MVNKVLYQELHPHEFIERVNACPIAYLPLGTLEWHSFHLPYGSDMVIPLEMFKRIAAQAGGVVLPPLFLGPDGVLEHDGIMYYGMDFYSFQDGHPQHLIGNMHFIPEGFFIQIIEYIMQNLKRSGFAAFTIFGHGPSADAVLKYRERLESQFEMKVYCLSDFCGEEPDSRMPGDHAAFYETAMFMGVCPGVADLSLLPDDGPPVSVWGRDPREGAIQAEGDRLIALYIEKSVTRLIDINKSLPKPELKLEFHHVKDIRY